MKDDKSILYIDIFSGESEIVSDEEYVEKQIEAQPLIDFYNQKLKPSKEQLELEEENKHITKTRMKLTREVIHSSYVQSFNDNYHRDKGDVTIEEENEVRKLKRRYPKYTDWYDAKMVYDDYMEKLYQKYGGINTFNLLFKYGRIPEYVPPEPKIKPTALNKTLLKNKVILSPASKDKENTINLFELSFNELLELLGVDPNVVEEYDIKTLNKDKAKKAVVKFIEEFDKNANNKFAKSRDAAMLNGGIDFIMEYFETKSKYDKQKASEDYESDEVSLQDLLDDNFVTEEDLANDKDEMIWYNGMMIKKSVLNEDSVYRELLKLGWDAKKIMRTTVGDSKKGIAYQLLKRADKKAKKDKKKNKKLNKVKDDFMSTLIFDNSYDSYGDFEEDMLNFTASNIFK